jgi:hypothetical protein
MFDAQIFVGADVLADELVSIWLYVACLLDYSALVWGSSAKHKPQRVGREHLLEDEDVVQIIKKV